MGLRLVIVGGGRMGEALVGGLLAAGWAAADLGVVEPVAERRRLLDDRFAGVTTAERSLAGAGTVLAVKPAAVAEAAGAAVGAGTERLLSIAAGVLVGLPRPTAVALTTQTLLGAARLLAEGDEGPEALRAAVTSPGGTTAAGLRVLEARAVRSAVIEAVAAATARSAELGRG